MLLDEWHVSIELTEGVDVERVDDVLGLVELELLRCARRIERRVGVTVTVSR